MANSVLRRQLLIVIIYYKQTLAISKWIHVYMARLLWLPYEAIPFVSVGFCCRLIMCILTCEVDASPVNICIIYFKLSYCLVLCDFMAMEQECCSKCQSWVILFRVNQFSILHQCRLLSRSALATVFTITFLKSSMSAPWPQCHILNWNISSKNLFLGHSTSIIKVCFDFD